MTHPIRVLELRSVWGTGGGPDKTIMLGACRRPDDISTSVCYIRDARDRVFSLDKRAVELGVDYVEAIERHSFDPAVWQQLRTIVREKQIDIVHGHEHKSALLAWMLGRAERVIGVSTAHGWSGTSRSEQMYYAVEKRILARLPHVIAVSGDIKRELVRTGCRPDRVTVIQNGIDHRAFARSADLRTRTRAALGLDDRDIIIGSVGRLDTEKRYDVLISAFAVLRRIAPRCRLVIAGDGRRRADLERQITDLGLSGCCELLGHRNDVSALHQAFDVFVQSSDREGTPNAVLEAMAVETPVVATNVGGTGGIVDDGVHGLLVEPGNPDVLARAIIETITNPQRARARAEAARRRIESELSFDLRMTRVEDLYRNLRKNHTTRQTCMSGYGCFESAGSASGLLRYSSRVEESNQAPVVRG